MSVTPPPLPSNESVVPRSRMRGVAMAAVWIIWVGVTLAADFLGFLMFAFADSPGSAKTAQLMIAPFFVWIAFTFVTGVVLLVLRRISLIAVAFVLAISPPFVIFAGYNLLDGSGRTSVGPPSTQNAPIVPTPPGGFVPKLTTPQQPDFRKSLERYTTQPTTRGHENSSTDEHG
jgi:hypothetical protein